jgi:hypothetical protein
MDEWLVGWLVGTLVAALDGQVDGWMNGQTDGKGTLSTTVYQGPFKIFVCPVEKMKWLPYVV